MLTIKFKDVDWSNELARTENMVMRLRLALMLAKAFHLEEEPQIRHRKREFNRKLLRLKKTCPIRCVRYTES